MSLTATNLRSPTLVESIGLGGASCIFTVNFTHPIELVKTRMQVSGHALGSTVTTTFAKEGIGAFWKGIAWAWGREGSYASIKLGAYAPVRDAIGAGEKNGTLGLTERVVVRHERTKRKKCAEGHRIGCCVVFCQNYKKQRTEQKQKK